MNILGQTMMEGAALRAEKQILKYFKYLWRWPLTPRLNRLSEKPIFLYTLHKNKVVKNGHPPSKHESGVCVKTDKKAILTFGSKFITVIWVDNCYFTSTAIIVSNINILGKAMKEEFALKAVRTFLTDFKYMWTWPLTPSYIGYLKSLLLDKSQKESSCQIWTPLVKKKRSQS